VFLRQQPLLRPERVVKRPRSTFLSHLGSLCVVITRRTAYPARVKIAAIRRNRFGGKWSRATGALGVDDLFLPGSRGRPERRVVEHATSSPKSKPRPRRRRRRRPQSIFEEIVADVEPRWLSD